MTQDLRMTRFLKNFLQSDSWTHVGCSTWKHNIRSSFGTKMGEIVVSEYLSKPLVTVCFKFDDGYMVPLKVVKQCIVIAEHIPKLALMYEGTRVRSSEGKTGTIIDPPKDDPLAEGALAFVKFDEPFFEYGDLKVSRAYISPYNLTVIDE